MPVRTNMSSGSTMPPKLKQKIANECPNILVRAKLKPLNKSYNYSLVHSEHMTDEYYEKLMNLFKTLMKEMYERSSWGWDEAKKYSEMKDPKTRILIITKNTSSKPSETVTFSKIPKDNEDLVGFMCFRFEKGSDKSESALYVYELHVDGLYQRQGLGEELMEMAKTIALEFKMDKIMLTVFSSNLQALQFYKKLKYHHDKSNPAKNEADYQILSLKLKN